MTKFASENPDKVSRLVIYAPQWYRTASTNKPTTAYRLTTEAQAWERWYNMVPYPGNLTLIPDGVFEAWWNATVATDPLAHNYSPPAIRSPNGIQLDNYEFWSQNIAPYNISNVKCPVLVIRGDWFVIRRFYRIF